MRNLFILLMLCAFAINADGALSKRIPKPIPGYFDISVSGVVTGQDGLPLPGIMVKIKGTNIATATNQNGAFRLTLKSLDGILVFSAMGYVSKEVTINNSLKYDVVLIADSKSLNEVVIIGYGTQQKLTVSNSISSMTSAQIEKQVTGNILTAMEGQMPGVEVRQGSGRPGENPTVRIRGTGSINASNAPLYVVDGLPLEDASDINSINPNDIATIDVLKDAASAAIYGSRGGNGVIIITTKMGSARRTKFDFSFYTGASEVSKKMQVLNRDQYIQYQKEGFQYTWVQSGGDPSIPNAQRPNGYRYLPMYDNPDTIANTNWQDEIFRTAIVSNYQVGLQGGSDKFNYYVSGNYLNQEGIVKATNLSRYSFRANVNATLNKYLKMGFNITPTYGVENLRPTDGHFNGAFNDGATLISALMMPPTIPARFPDGTYGQTLGSKIFTGNVAITSPLQKLEDPNYINRSNTYRLQGMTYIEVNPIKELVYRMDFGGDYKNASSLFYRPSTVSTASAGVNIPGVQSNVANIASNSSQITASNYTWNNQVTYNKTFAKVHRLNATAVFSIQKSNSDLTTLTGQSGSFANDLIQNVQGASIINGTSSSQAWSLMSYLGRATYDYKSKYLLTASVRRDGTSRFAPDHQWGTFPSVSAGWRISEEDFFKQITAISELKVRASYGVTGNFSIGNYAWRSTLISSNYNFGSGDGKLVNGYAPNNFKSPNLTWETNKQLGGGFDIGLLRNRIYLAADIYRRVTSNLLYNRPIPGNSGFNQYLGNIGSVENKGIELDLRTTNIVSRKFTWNSSINFSLNRNKVIKLGENNEPILATTENTVTQLIQVGQPFAVFYGYPTAGIFKDQADVAANPQMKFSAASGPGDTKFVDTNKDGVISEADRTILGNPTPNFSYGVTNSFFYQNFDLSIQIQGVQGGDIYYLGSRFVGANQLTFNQLAVSVLNRWKSESEPGNGNYPRIGSVGLAPSNVQRYLYDGSYLRIRNVSLGYTLPPGKLKKIGVSALRLYVTGQNLYTFTKYIGYNPEVNQYGEAVSSIGLDYGSYPLSRSVVFGINLSF
ncbi:SusC/RagA family TonB-linked outer membrane protein [Mucilaginibacter pocheonensis]|uniref:TonB-linked SusC/RagA family outer membrane protein n=1 Tax=Mucilaginibacter pocheonensis TaxID=398050 RepID=A0ABU1TCP7_9SPHI|nr:TonB-dependent receptor [Mucilaginibacter pocheonensis]MDR6942965.1 TonB-linked SusC/RagA family outer membrane protein [Mucilaginibacter pocheonensis]